MSAPPDPPYPAMPITRSAIMRRAVGSPAIMSLGALQAAMADAVLRGGGAAAVAQIVADGLDPVTRIGIHRNTARATMEAALALNFPAVRALVGEDFFAMLAARAMAAMPPAAAVLAGYGADFAGFLAAVPEAAGLPYLPDVARYERAAADAASAPDAPALDPAALAAVPPERHAALRIRAHASVRLLRLDHPADHIAEAVLAEDDARMAALDPAAGPVHLLIHRGPDGVASHRLAPAEFAFLARLFAGAPFGALLGADFGSLFSADADDAPADPAALLARGLVAGWFAAVPDPSAEPPPC